MSERKLQIKKPRFVAASLAAALSAGAFLSFGQMWEGIFVSHYSERTEKMADCTILFYMNGSDLESDCQAATADLMEIQSVLDEIGEDADIRIVVEAGGCFEWSYEPIRDCEYSRFEMRAHEEPEVQSMQPRNMGRSDTLSDFINYGTAEYPAEHYGLVFWNHGQGPIYGFGSDQNFGGDSLTLDEIRDGIAKSDFAHPFDFVAFDACLMASYELVSVLNGHARYLIASEDLEPQDGYDYVWIQDVPAACEDDSQSFGHEIGCSMLKSYHDYYTRLGIRATLSMVDMSQYEKFQEELQLCLDLEQVDDWQAFFLLLQQRRTSIPGYGAGNPMMLPDIVDLKAFVATILACGGQTEQLDGFYEAFDLLVKEKVDTGEDNPASGLSIFWPSDSRVTDAEALQIHEKLPMGEAYRTFVEDYRSALAQEIDFDWQEVSVLADEICVEVAATDLKKIANVYLQTFFIEENGETAYLLSSDSAVTIDRNGYLKAKAGHVFWGLNGQPLSMIEVMDTRECTQYISPIRYNGQLCNMMLQFDYTHSDGEIVSIVPMESDKQVYQISEGDVLVPLYPYELVGEAEGYEEMYLEGKEIPIRSLEAGDAELERIEVDEEACWYGFLIRDVTQNLQYSELVHE